jgi:pyrimidine operon attenuation protein/uracil phosphoribosyltransferase
MTSNQLPQEWDAERCYQTLLELLKGALAPGDHLVGVQSKGVWIAQRLHRDLNLTTPLGLITSSMHRDDFAIRGLSKTDQTHLPFDIDSSPLVLVDDVLFTGRTVRAIVNELFDFGRPPSIRLAVMIDRGGRQLPIQADYVALKVQVPTDQKVSLLQRADGTFAFDTETGGL